MKMFLSTQSFPIHQLINWKRAWCTKAEWKGLAKEMGAGLCEWRRLGHCTLALLNLLPLIICVVCELNSIIYKKCMNTFSPVNLFPPPPYTHGMHTHVHSHTRMHEHLHTHTCMCACTGTHAHTVNNRCETELIPWAETFSLRESFGLQHIHTSWLEYSHLPI